MKKITITILVTATLAACLTFILHNSSFITHNLTAILTGLAVAGACLLIVAGIIIGALWTYASMRAGARLATPGYLAAHHTQTEATRTLRDGLRIFNPSSPPFGGQGGPGTIGGGAWLPPLQDFDIIDHDDITGGNSQ